MIDPMVGRVLDALPLAVLLLDDSGKIRAANREAGVLLAHDPASLVGTPILEAVVAGPGGAGLERNLPERIRSGSLDLLLQASLGEGSLAVRLRVHLRSIGDTGEGTGAIALLERVPARDEAAALARAADIASRVKHDVNNLLMGFLGHAGLLRGRPELSDASREKVALLEQQGVKIRDRIADLDGLRRLASEFAEPRD